MKRVSWLLCLVLGLLWSARASAQAAPALHLSWVRSEGAASCPDVGQVERDVESRLGKSPFAADSGLSGAIEVTVARDQSTFRASIVMRDASGALLGSREVESRAEACDSLGSAAALAIALMLQPELSRVESARRSVAPAPKAQPAPSAPPTPAAAPPARHLLYVAGGVSALAGALPELGVGPHLQAGVQVVPHLVLAAGAYFLPQQWLERGGARAAFGLTLGSVEACLRFPLDQHFALSSCGVAAAGAMHVAVASPLPVDPGDGLWLAAGCGLGISLVAGPVEVRLGGSALGHFRRRDYRVERGGDMGQQSVFVEPALIGLSSLSLGARL